MGLMTVALLGVFAMQLYYIRQAYRLNSQLFEQDVNQALNAVVTKVQMRDAAVSLRKRDLRQRRLQETEVRNQAQQIVEYKERFKEQEEKRKMDQQKLIVKELNLIDRELNRAYAQPWLISEKEFRKLSSSDKTLESPLNLDVNLGIDAFGNVVSSEIKSSFVTERVEAFNVASDQLPDSIRYIANDPVTGRPLLISLPRINAEMSRKFKMEDAIARSRYEEGLKRLVSDTIPMEASILDQVEDVAKEMQESNIPLSKMVPQGVLDTLIKRELLNRNIDLQYDFWVSLAQKDSLVYSNASNPAKEYLPKNTFKATLYKYVTRDPGMLYIHFPNKNSLIFANLGVTMASSAGLLLVLVFIFSYTLYAILKQKKISEMKTDFINNMTHEFKTPVATIMIASEALKDPEVAEDKGRINRLAGIIYDENVRLGNHIERVLSIARLEKKELELEKNPVYVNDVVAAVADSMSLQLQRKAAHLELNLEAEESIVVGDELHLSNVIYNLIDNANKYSADFPRITVNTYNALKKLVIEVKDEGIGMTKDQTKRIFDQFYRVPTGNLHDVKGFGLGLNYVQDIIGQMGGTIKVHSEKDRGTTFEISIPLINS